MIKLFISSVVILAMATPAAGILTPQDIVGGTVKYQQTIKQDLSRMLRGSGSGRMRGNPRIRSMIESMPKERRENKVLYFAEHKSLYLADQIEEEAQTLEMDGGRMRIQFMRPTTVKLQKAYYDFDNNEKIEQVGFMTRDFLVSGEINKNAWKLTNKLSKIMGYACMAAQMQRGENNITAWFTSEIPFSGGPAEYFGLPGLILAVEIDGETAFLATSISLVPPSPELLIKPVDGKKVTQIEFDNIMAEKIKEFEETRDQGRVHRIRVLNQ